MFGDRATILPDGLLRPDHWSETPLERRWVADPEYQAWLGAGAPPGKPVGPAAP